MDESTIKQLAEINDRFYRQFGKAFAETRRRIQPGVGRVLQEFVKDGNWLDLGCGSGTLARVWRESGIHGLYEGLDFSPVLIGEARRANADCVPDDDLQIIYNQADLNQPDWIERCSRKKYDGVLMFAAMHHIPSQQKRLLLLKQIAAFLEPGGIFIHSEWQFQRSPKLMTHVQPWSKVDLDASTLEEGDMLMDWRHTDPERPNEIGLRYVHLFTARELEELAEESGFTILDEFDSDGASGNLSLYQIWKKL
jgi:SAM-dependent methyltransferase